MPLASATGSVSGWAVFAPTAGVPAGALAGEYVGVSADVGLGLGAGANVLLDDNDRLKRLRCVSLRVVESYFSAISENRKCV